ncbi:hypothetical protein BC939DRAFT_441313 [Gamsiella multidivaricata]|uniref:uncharacterized protein n=1 Tax=Gamsiella multidivaricata TaxID=101098 RepID=UPI00221F8365|nr:uncharacterized protein BC939DRAFT_441313 [Gamsiella multidivaricata]KAI7829630.1 hypothetical protein BC939DRAFT_441313 [Gamsiella multidivaricata]
MRTVSPRSVCSWLSGEYSKCYTFSFSMYNVPTMETAGYIIACHHAKKSDHLLPPFTTVFSLVTLFFSSFASSSAETFPHQTDTSKKEGTGVCACLLLPCMSLSIPKKYPAKTPIIIPTVVLRVLKRAFHTRTRTCTCAYTHRVLYISLCPLLFRPQQTTT